MAREFVTVDGNEAAAWVAHQTNEVCAIYPITPASPMGELADAWSAADRTNIYGVVPEVIEMQSEGGAAGAVHGALQAGALTTTFTASQGLLLMIPNMYKIAGELTPTVFHIAARSLATHALSIFGDHSDVMSCRGTGWAMLSGNSVQEAHDFALISQAATLRSRIPFLHFFDGFRTSHEVTKIERLDVDDLRAMIPDELVQAHRERALTPDAPSLRGTAQNPDVFFQAREACNRYYEQCPGIVQAEMDRFAERVGRRYRLFDYVGASDAERVIVMLGSGCGAAEEAVAHLTAAGEKVGLVKVRLFRPWSGADLLAALPPTVKSIAALDRTKEPGGHGEPLLLDVATTIFEQWPSTQGGQPYPRVVGGRYGLSSKEFTPAMVAGIFQELAQAAPKPRFTVGIRDDVTQLSLDWDDELSTEKSDVTRAIFYGLGSDGTVGANKNSVKIIGENTDLFAQGYFVYDSKKSGAQTVSHLRFSPHPISSTYLIKRANFVACHQFQFVHQLDVLGPAEPGATFLLNSPHSAAEVWDKLPREMQQRIIDLNLKFYVVDALHVAKEVGLKGRINTVMQACFFMLSGVLPRDKAIEEIKRAIKKSYGKYGESVLKKNFDAVDAAVGAVEEVAVPTTAEGEPRHPAYEPGVAPEFFERVTSQIIAGRGDLLPVSAFPVDGTFPTATAQFEKRSIADEIPIWDPEICTQCALCSLLCPHAAIRMKVYGEDGLEAAPGGFQSRPYKGKDFPGFQMSIQVAPEDCTGCGVCVDVCPAKSREQVKHKAINMRPKLEHLEQERANYQFFLELPEPDRRTVKIDSVKGSQTLLPLFEYSGACSGCGETPYIKLATQMFGDRMLIANATGCTSIYGGNLPTTPYALNREGRGPAWSNSLFEDNAEFGLGFRLGVDAEHRTAVALVKELREQIGHGLAQPLIECRGRSEEERIEQRERVAKLKQKLAGVDSPSARRLLAIADSLTPRSVWIVGGDGWAYDIGFGGVDHVLASGRDVNLLVLDTGVYSNTGGQASKATPRGAVAKFAASGKPIRRKDLGMLAVSYGGIYVAQIAIGANPAQAIKAFHEAETYPGPSLILAYSQCIAHGIDMTTGMTHQKDLVKSGFWPLYRYDPRQARAGEHPFHLDSRKPSLSFKEVARQEARFAMLERTNKQQAELLFAQAQADIDETWHYYEQMAGVERTLLEANAPVEALSSAAGGNGHS